jgi:glycosyltransferase involved in cell wall biosynthesis
MHIVTLLAPIRCGVYRFYCELSRKLSARGHSITWLCSGALHKRLMEGEEADTDIIDGEIVVADAQAIGKRTKAIVERIAELSPELVLCNALGDQIDFNAVRYLPTTIPRALVMHNNSLACYRAARAVREHVNATVSISPRIQEDLTSNYGFRGRRVELIPYSIDFAGFSAPARTDRANGRLRILSHGRIDKAQKGLLWLPEIIAELDRRTADWELTISGDGPDLPELKSQFAEAGLADRVQYLGWTDPNNVPGLMERHDVFLFPSRFEGFGKTLIEAMAGGCVPVASLLPGITDWIIEDGVSGFLFPVGDVKRATAHLLDLCNDRNRLAAMRDSAREAASTFSLDRMADSYEELFQELLSQPGNIEPAKPLDDCVLPAGLRPAWWFRLPEPLKDRLRVAREIARTHVRVP